MLLREYTRDSFWLTYFWKDKSFGFLKTHDIVVLLQPEYGRLEKGNTVAIPVQEHRQIVFDIFLGEIVRQLVKIQHSLGNLQAVVVDTAVGILSQTKFFGKQRYTVPEFGNSINRPVQGIVGHGVLWCRGRLRALLA